MNLSLDCALQDSHTIKRKIFRYYYRYIMPCLEFEKNIVHIIYICSAIGACGVFV